MHSFDTDISFEQEITSVGCYVAVAYDDNWWIGLVLEKDDIECDVKVKFLSPNGPSIYFNWPQSEVTCFVPNNCFEKPKCSDSNIKFWT